MKSYDAVVVGGGVLGCFTARELMRYDLSVALIDSREDVCTGISKANTAIVYPGYDHKPGTLKARMTLKANADFDRLCGELGVPFSRCGSLMVSTGDRADSVLERKYKNGLAIGVPALRLISGEEAREYEPLLSPDVRRALYSPTAGTVDPWELCYAAFENAVANGCQWLANTELLAMRREDGRYILETSGGELTASAVINCAGLYADRVHEMLFAPSVRIYADGADYFVLERNTAKLTHIIQQETDLYGKGITAVPTVGGGILLGAMERETEAEKEAVSPDYLELTGELAGALLPGLMGDNVIRRFSALRPNPQRVILRDGRYVPDGKSFGTFAIETPEPGYVGFIGIKTPGLTCSAELGKMAATRTAAFLEAKERDDFDPIRVAPVRIRSLGLEARKELCARDGRYGEILCHCEEISRGEVLDAIRRGAVTADGVKRRCGAMLGVCQGSRCLIEIMELLSQELGIPVSEVRKGGADSYILGGRHG